MILLALRHWLGCKSVPPQKIMVAVQLLAGVIGSMVLKQ